jgi:hypothetical protein
MVMSFKPNWRDNAIDTLINDDIDSFNNGFEHGLAEILYSGFKGYQNYTDEQLEVELNERDISTVFGDNDD